MNMREKIARWFGRAIRSGAADVATQEKLLRPGVVAWLQRSAGLSPDDPRYMEIVDSGTRMLAVALAADVIRPGEEFRCLEQWLCRLDPELPPLAFR